MMTQIDHFVLTVQSLEATCSFYQRVLGLTHVETFGRPSALRFGTCKINLHEVGHTFEAKAATPMPCSADFCLIAEQSIHSLIQHLESENVLIEAGPVERNGARGVMISVYFRDPDGNLAEVSRYNS